MGDARILWGPIGASVTMDTKWMQRGRYAAILMSASWKTHCAAVGNVETPPVVSRQVLFIIYLIITSLLKCVKAAICCIN